MKKSVIIFLMLLFCMNIYATGLATPPLTTIGKTQFIAHDDKRNVNVNISVWYPVAAKTKATDIPEALKHAPAAINAPIKSNNKLPLILLSHGWGGKPELLAWIVDAMVTQGYIVAAPQHTSDITNPPSFNYWNRPLDISLTLTQLLNSKFKSNIDPERIGFIGYSLGGATGIWLAGGRAKYFQRTIFPGEKYTNTNVFIRKTAEEIKNTKMELAKKSFYDPRIKAELLMAPAFGWVFSQESLNKISIPIKIIESASDSLIKPETNAFYFASHIPSATLKMIPGKADHFVFRAEILPGKMRVFDPTGNSDFIFTDDSSVNRGSIHDYIAQKAVKFFNKKLKMNK